MVRGLTVKGTQLLIAIWIHCQVNPTRPASTMKNLNRKRTKWQEPLRQTTVHVYVYVRHPLCYCVLDSALKVR